MSPPLRAHRNLLPQLEFLELNRQKYKKRIMSADGSFKSLTSSVSVGLTRAELCLYHNDDNFVAQADLIEEQVGQIIKLPLGDIESNYTDIEYKMG